MMNTFQKPLLIAGFLGLLSSVSVAQRWQCDVLPGGGSLYVRRIVGDTQVGYQLSGNGHALILHGPGGPVDDLNPPGYTSSKIWGATPQFQVGTATLDGIERAAIWQGTAASHRELVAPGASFAAARDFDGGVIYGFARINDVMIACSWDEATGTFNDLNPPGATESRIYASKMGRQYGEATLNGTRKGYVWQNGLPLGPLDDIFLQSTLAAGTDGQAGVGTAFVLNDNWRAVYWSHPSGQMIDLDGPLSRASQAYAIEAGKVVGYQFVNNYEAAIWHLDTQVIEDLHQYVPGTGGSTANDLDVLPSGEILAVGNKVLTGGGPGEGLMWHFFPGKPFDVDSFSIVRGSLAGGGLASLLAVDGDALIVRNGPVASMNDSPITVVFDGDNTVPSPKRLRFGATLKASASGLQGTLDLWDWSASQWDPVDFATLALGVNQASFEADTRNNPARYARASDGAVRARLRVKAIGPVTGSSWYVMIDKAGWIITQ